MASFNNNLNNRSINRKRRDDDQSYFTESFQQNSFDSTHKKMRMDRPNINPPSKVINIRNVPSTMADANISYLAVPFGFIDNIVFVRKNSQALIQMRDLREAEKMVDYFSKGLSLFHGSHLSIHYSKHQQLDSKHDSAMKIVEQANEKREQYLSNWSDKKSGSNEILCILIDKAPNLIINHLVFYKIFSRFGKIMRIVCYTKKEQHFGLVEFVDPIPAHVAQLQLNYGRLLGDSGKMKIDFSKVAGPLLVERQSDKVRDYSKKPINKGDEYEMSSPHYDFPLFSTSMNRDADRSIRSNVDNLVNLQRRRSPINVYNDRSSQFHSDADLASAIRLMSYLNPSLRNHSF